MNEPNTKPVSTQRFDRVHAAIFCRSAGEDSDSARSLFSAAISRSYQDRNKKWVSTSSFDERDLPHLRLAGQWAHEEIKRLQREETGM